VGIHRGNSPRPGIGGSCIRAGIRKGYLEEECASFFGAGLPVCMYVCMCVCMHAMQVCVCVCRCVGVHVCICVYMKMFLRSLLNIPLAHSTSCY